MQTEIGTQKTDKLSFTTKFSYGIGDLAGNLSWGLVSSYLLFFYTDVFGLAAGAVGVLMLIARIWDCFADPLVGFYVERKDTKYGRFRPYILFGSILFAIFNTLTFTTPNFSQTGKMIYATITYLILGTIFAIVNVPYGALATVMTRDTEERTSLNSFRGFFGLISSVITGAAVMPLISILGKGNNQKGFFLTALVLSIIAIPMFYIVFRNCKEVIRPEKSEHPTFKQSIQAVISNKPLALVLTYLLLMFTALFGKLGVVVYYYIYVLGRPDLIAPLMAGFGVCTAFGAILVGLIAKFFEKRTLLIIGMTIAGLSTISIYLMPVNNITAIILLTTLGSIPIGFGAPMMFSMVGDCIDYSEWKNGSRADGAIYSITSLMTKISSALIGAVTAFALGVIGYVPNAQQSPEAIHYINIMVNLIPGILFILSTLPLYFYTLTKAKSNQYSKEILERRQNSISE